jgi:hypothetical protein
LKAIGGQAAVKYGESDAVLKSEDEGATATLVVENKLLKLSYNGALLDVDWGEMCVVMVDNPAGSVSAVSLIHSPVHYVSPV